ncbi:MAG: hypothetical protein ACOH5I_22405 [Oligoflexus sp.]
MSDQNYEDLVCAIEHIAEGLERLAMLSLDLKKKLDESQKTDNAVANAQ